MLRSLVQNYEKKKKEPLDIWSVLLVIIYLQNNTIMKDKILVYWMAKGYHLSAHSLLYKCFVVVDFLKIIQWPIRI